MIETEEHNRWSENYCYKTVVERDCNGRFVRLVDSGYLGKIFRSEDIKDAERAAQSIKDAIEE